MTASKVGTAVLPRTAFGEKLPFRVRPRERAQDGPGDGRGGGFKYHPAQQCYGVIMTPNDNDDDGRIDCQRCPDGKLYEGAPGYYQCDSCAASVAAENIEE